MIDKWYKIATGLLFFLLLGGFLGQLHGETPPSREYKLKAGLIYTLTKFVDYPVTATVPELSHFTIGILGQDPFQEEIDILNDKIIQDQKIEVIRYKRVEEIEACHMLFISRSETAMRASIIDALKKKTILTISDMDDFAEAGGMIHFITVNNRIRFKVNLTKVREADLKLSSQFLKLAIIIDPQATQEGDYYPK